MDAALVRSCDASVDTETLLCEDDKLLVGELLELLLNVLVVDEPAVPGVGLKVLLPTAKPILRA